MRFTLDVQRLLNSRSALHTAETLTNAIMSIACQAGLMVSPGKHEAKPKKQRNHYIEEIWIAKEVIRADIYIQKIKTNY